MPMAEALKIHNTVLRQAIHANAGVAFKTVGDSIQAAFVTAPQALKAAIDGQRHLHSAPWNELGQLKVRMGIHTGEAELDPGGDEYTVSHAKNRVARIMSAAHGGQVVLSAACAELLQGNLPAQTSLVDLGNHYLKGLLRPEHLYQVAAPGLMQEFPPLNSLTRVLHNLPVQLSSFIGRQREIDEVSQLLNLHRLVTLVGAGGAGKTRLVIQVGLNTFESFTDGVWFVDLTSLSEPSLIPDTALVALGLQSSGVPDLSAASSERNQLSRLTQTLRVKSLLLILDNCEHLVDGCAKFIQELLSLCPSLHILATSREPLNVSAEKVFRVPSLEIPDPQSFPHLAALAQVESVHLFVERASLVDASFSLTLENALPVAQICQRLDGIPLAIELTAARVKVMTPGQIVERMQDIFRLLGAGSRDALPRHQTLSAAIEWSYSLLSDAEKKLFRRLAVFNGGWSLEAAEAVCAGDSADPYEVLMLLGQLVDKSLVIKVDRGSEARFFMTETIRQYAVHQLFASENEVEQTSARHCEWILDLAEQAKFNLRTQKQLSWLMRLSQENDNIRTAIRWALENKKAEIALRLVGGFNYYWIIHYANIEGYNLTRQVLDLVKDDPVQCQKLEWAWATCGFYRFFLFVSGISNLSSPDPLLGAYRICQLHDDRLGSGLALLTIGENEALHGNWRQAEQFLDQSREIFEEEPALSYYAESIIYSGMVALERGEVNDSQKYCQQSLELHPMHGDRFVTLQAMYLSANSFFIQGDLSRAYESLLEMLDVAEELENRGALCIFYNYLAVYSRMQGQYAQARTWVWKAIRLSDEFGEKGFFATLAEIELMDGHYERVQAIVDEGIHWARQDKVAGARFGSLFWLIFVLGHLALHRKDPASARRFFEEAQSYQSALGTNLEGGLRLTQALAHTTRIEGQPNGAYRLYLDNLNQMLIAQYDIYIPESLEDLAMLMMDENRIELAARLFGVAQAERQRLGTPLHPYLRAEYELHQACLVQLLGQVKMKKLLDEGNVLKPGDAILIVQQEYGKLRNYK